MRAARRLARWLLGAGLALSSPAAQAGPPVAVAATAERLERVAWVWIQPEGLRLPRGLSERIYARVDFVDGRVEYHYPTTGWSVAPADGAPVAAVSDRGEVRALAPGRATLRLAYLGRTAEAPVTVFDEPPTALTLSPSSPTLDLGTELEPAINARFGTDVKWWDVKAIVRWSVADLGPERGVLIDKVRGRWRAQRVGTAELRAELRGQRAATPVMVVERLRDSPQRLEGRRVPPPGLYRLCMNRLRRLWVPRLRTLTRGAVRLTGGPRRREANIHVTIDGDSGPGIDIFWNPDECDAMGPTSGWRAVGFDWRAPQTPLEQMLVFAGNDCLSYRER